LATATTPVPSAPPNFYAQAASGQGGQPSPMSPGATPPAAAAHAEDSAKFRRAVEKLLVVFSQMEKLKPNGQDISKELKAMAQTLKDTQSKVFEGAEGEGMDLNIDTAGGGAAAGGSTAAAGPAAPSTPPTPGTGA